MTSASLLFPGCVLCVVGVRGAVLQTRSWTLESFSETELESGNPVFYRG